MIPWKDNKTHQPEDDKLVWVLTCHWKERKPGSYQIFRGYTKKIAGGEVESHIDKQNIRLWRVNTCDDDGGGCYCYYPKGSQDLGEYEEHYEVFTHWCYDHEINVPNEVDKC